MKVNREQAVRELDKWFEFKKIRTNKREANKEFEETIVSAIIEGDLVIDENSNIKFKLPEPMSNSKGEVTVEELVFKPRLKVRELNAELRGVKNSDGDGRIVAYIAAITGQAPNIITNLYTEDYSLCTAIVMYFL
jgi:hypothetical protein